MDTARVVQLRQPAPPAPSVRVDADRLTVERIVVSDRSLAAFVAERPPEDRGALVQRALTIGLVALQDAGVSVNVDAVKREFEGLMAQTTAANERAAAALDQMLRQNFSDGEGRLPRTLEKFLGDRGALRSFVNELFDETKRDSAIGKMRMLLGTYFDGDASRLAQRRAAPSVRAPPRRAATSRRCSDSCWAASRAGAATCSTGPGTRPAASCAPRRATS
jgi:hypothetical protein